MWAAYFQADNEHRHTISVVKTKHRAEFDVDNFVARMTNPEVGVWFVWVEEVTDGDIAKIMGAGLGRSDPLVSIPEEEA